MKNEYIIKNNVGGFTKCPNWLRQKYIEAVNYRCQICKFHQTNVGKLQIHRIKRGNQGGLYTICPLNHKDNNIKVLCSDCHKELHYKEFNKK